MVKLVNGSTCSQCLHKLTDCNRCDGFPYMRRGETLVQLQTRIARFQEFQERDDDGPRP